MVEKEEFYYGAPDTHWREGSGVCVQKKGSQVISMLMKRGEGQDVQSCFDPDR